MERFKTTEEMVWAYTTMEDPKEENIHSPVGASSASRWIGCPGSNNLIAKVPKKAIEPKEYSAEGTVAHRLGEQALLQLDFLGLSDQDIQFWLDGWVDTVIEQEGFEIVIAQDLADAVFVYVKAIKDIMLKHNAPYEYLSVEHEFIMTEVDKQARGTTDAMIEIPYETLYIIDLKAGKGVPVDIKGNVQCMYYAVGGYNSTGKEVEEVVQIIVQPRCFHPDGPVREERYPVSQVIGFAGALSKAIAATRKKTAPLKSGSHCKWCEAKAICPEQDKMSLEVAKSEFMVIEEDTQLDASQVSKMVSFLEFESLFAERAIAIRSFLHGLAEQGTVVPGYKLVQKKANRAWEDKEVAEKRLVALLAKEAYEYPEPKLLTPAKAEKIWKKKKLTEDSMPPITKPDNGTVLVLVSDMRTSVQPSIETQFSVVEEADNLDDM